MMERSNDGGARPKRSKVMEERQEIKVHKDTRSSKLCLLYNFRIKKQFSVFNFIKYIVLVL